MASSSSLSNLPSRGIIITDSLVWNRRSQTPPVRAASESIPDQVLSSVDATEMLVRILKRQQLHGSKAAALDSTKRVPKRPLDVLGDAAGGQRRPNMGIVAARVSGGDGALTTAALAASHNTRPLAGMGSAMAAVEGYVATAAGPAPPKRPAAVVYSQGGCAILYIAMSECGCSVPLGHKIFEVKAA